VDDPWNGVDDPSPPDMVPRRHVLLYRPVRVVSALVHGIQQAMSALSTEQEELYFRPFVEAVVGTAHVVCLGACGPALRAGVHFHCSVLCQDSASNARALD
jgi:hypothetical protein